MNKSVFWVMGLLVGRDVTEFGNPYLNLCFFLYVPLLFLWHLPLMQPDSCQTSYVHANNIPL